MKGQQKGVRLTKVRELVMIKVEPGTENPPLPAIKKHYHIFIVVYKLLNTVHTDQTGQSDHLTMRLLVHHSGHPSGCKLYLLQINKEHNWWRDDHCLPKNGQQDEALSTRVESSLIGQQVFGEIQRMHHQEWDDSWVSPNLDCHHCNIAERVIQMFKHHFVSILSRVEDRFPLSLFCHLVQPAELTVNLLQ